MAVLDGGKELGIDAGIGSQTGLQREEGVGCRLCPFLLRTEKGCSFLLGKQTANLTLSRQPVTRERVVRWHERGRRLLVKQEDQIQGSDKDSASWAKITLSLFYAVDPQLSEVGSIFPRGCASQSLCWVLGLWL